MRESRQAEPGSQVYIHRKERGTDEEEKEEAEERARERASSLQVRKNFFSYAFQKSDNSDIDLRETGYLSMLHLYRDGASIFS